MPTQDPADKNLWHRIRSDDADAFKILYERYIEDLVRFGQHLTPNRDLVQDAIQNLFTRIWDKRSKLTPPSHTKAYLLRSLRNNLLRDANKERKIKKVDTDLHLKNHIASPIIDLDPDQIDKMKQAIEKLSIREREVIHLKYYQGIRNSEITEIMNISYQSVANLLQRALKHIKAKLGDPA